MTDLVVQNVRLATEPRGPLVDIGVVAGRIAVVAPGLDVDVPAFIELLVGRIADLDARLR